MSQSTLTKSRPVPSLNKAKIKRRDIQGLRAIAVLAVVLDHLLHWPSGGFVGVDVFFVISGFLITGLLLREHDKTGTISFSGFYKRRIRRIMPAAVTVLAVTAALSFVLFNRARADQTLWDAVWGFFFSANWRFAAIGTDYFQASGPVSPLQHFWSLAVEEQFYFVWPWLMLLIFWLGGRSTKWDKSKAHRAIGIAMIVITVLSFGWAMYESAANPTMAYFSTLSRTWELGIGALLAVFIPALRRLPSALRPVLAWVGIAGIVWGIFSINASMQFPAPWAAIPVLATALVIAAGTGQEPRFIWPLTNPVTDYVGNISYSLYLWHFPAIILLGSLMGEASPAYIPATLVVMFALSALSYRYIEQSILKSLWMDDSEAAKRERKNRRHKGRQIKQGTQFALLGILAVVTFSVVAVALTSAPKAEVFVAPAASPLATTGKTAETPLTQRATAITSALGAKDWPKLTPDLGELESKGRSSVSCELGPNDNLPSAEDVTGKCLNGDKNAPKTAVLLGDSYAAALSPGVINALTPQGYKVIVLTKNSCPAINIEVKLQGGAAYPGCTDFQSFATDKVRGLAPDLLVVTGWHGQVVDRLADGSKGAAALTKWQAAAKASYAEFAQSAKQVVVLAGPPTGRNLQECATPLSHPADCVAPVSGEYKTFSAAEQSAVTSLASKAVTYVPVLDWFCAADKCPPYIGANPVYVDGGHLTTDAAKAIAPLLADAFKG